MALPALNTARFITPSRNDDWSVFLANMDSCPITRDVPQVPYQWQMCGRDKLPPKSLPCSWW